MLLPVQQLEFHGGVVPYAVRDDHVHDLERVFVVLDPQTRRIRRIVGSAHDGVIPANRYEVAVGVEPPPLPIEILVERGSHAMAPDIDRDGLFMPGVDSTAPQHGGFEWGIRDHGETWSSYRTSYMDRREAATAIRLCADAPGDAETTPGCTPVSVGVG